MECRRSRFAEAMLDMELYYNLLLEGFIKLSLLQNIVFAKVAAGRVGVQAH